MTKNDEKVLQKETELKEVKEKLESHEKVVGELDRQYQQALEEKSILAEQLQAETELCAEAEEMRARLVQYHRYITRIYQSFHEGTMRVTPVHIFSVNVTHININTCTFVLHIL